MTDIRTTQISLTYTDMTGESRSLGTGSIDENGYISVDEPAAGEEDFVSKVLEELNAREYVVLKGPPASSDGPHFGITKRRVERDDDEFLSALVDYAGRLYGLTLAFDMTDIAPELPEEPESIESVDFGSGLDPENVPEGADEQDDEVNSETIDL